MYKILYKYFMTETKIIAHVNKITIMTLFI